MHAFNHELPIKLVKLIECGSWSAGGDELNPLLGSDAAQKLSPGDDRIILMPPPFHTIEDEVDGGNDFWITGVTNAAEIDYAAALIIADFGLGSDSPIVLYYGKSLSPCVMYLKWNGNGDNVWHQWVETHACFDDFARDVGLGQ